MKKVLVITYYWPPSGGAGVQRWLKYVKYLRDFGWEPVIFTPENPELPETDLSLTRDVPNGIEVLKLPIWEPYNFYKRFTGKPKETKISAGFLKEEKKTRFTDSISVWIRGNLFIPDARKFWIKPAVRFLSDYLQENKVDAIASTGPPHTCHLIAFQLSKKTNIPWLADFRDPWTGIDFYDQLKLSSYADKKHRSLELNVLKQADTVVVISPSMATDFEKIWKRKYNVITNGYDADDYKTESDIKPDIQFSISHIGSLVPARNPVVLWEALAEMIRGNHPIKNHLLIKLVGKVDYGVLQDAEKYGLTDYIQKIEYLPHNEVVKVQMQSQVLLLLINDTPNARSILTGKFFEYLAAQRPILCIGPEDGDAARILSTSNAGICVNYSNKSRMKRELERLYEEYSKGSLGKINNTSTQYSRKNLTGLLAAELDRIA
jgi:glycosyltransferase involved in cell wall biosynthesis